MVILPFGQAALLAEVATLEEVLALHRRLAASVPDGVIDLVPAARTVLVTFDPSRITAAHVRAFLERASDAAEPPDAASDIYEIDTVYDGPDLHDTAMLLGMSPEALVAAHRGAEWSVAFTGFAPGFGYLVSADWRFAVPRLDSPRTRVPAGSVGVAGEFSGAYPRVTPGGWRLIGTTDARLFDPDSDTPALLTPGARVRFVERSREDAYGKFIDASPRVVSAVARPTAREEATPDSGVAGIRIVEPGLLATIQDLGRPGRAALGVARSGALDRGALRTANRLLGNPEAAAAIEITMGGFRAVAEHDLWFAVAGAWGPIRLDGRVLDPYQPHPWRAGSELHLDWFARGARAYLAVRGGIDLPESVGSRSTDLLAGLGPALLVAGMDVGVGPEPGSDIPGLAYAPWGPPEDSLLYIGLAAGPRAEWFGDAASDLLFSSVWSVSNEADRVGIRLDGPELPRLRTEELPSEGMIPGALQVPPHGRPVILGVDGPVTGGYPVIAVVAEDDRDLLAQARPGTRIRFRHVRSTG